MLSLSCGWFAAEALAWLGADVRIKWPNDLLLGERKVGGILVEERGEQCVAGIGINIAGELPSFSPREAWSPGPAWLSEAVIVDPFELLAALVKFGQHWYDDRVGQGPPGRFLPAFKKWMAWMDEVVRVHGDPLGKPEYTAKIIGLLPDGALLVERDGGTEALRSGSIAPARDGAG